MKEIVVISGKGGTGKTSIVAAFAALADNAALADCDVDAADLHLILKPTIKESRDFAGGKRASILSEKCIGCGKCKDVCHFDALKFNGVANEIVQKTYTVDLISCEGCGVCTWFCPVDAIEFKYTVNGQWFISETRFGPMVHAKLGIAEENSGKLVSLIRKEAKEIALQQNKELIIVDGSPGIGCPVIASIGGADSVLIVTEPTLSAQHDFGRVVKLANHFKIPAAVCINKFDINHNIAKEIALQAEELNIPVAGRIAYDESVTKAQVIAESIVEYFSNTISEQIKSLWKTILNLLNKNSITQ